MPSACQAQLFSSWPVAQFVPSAVRSTSRQPLTGPVPSRRRAAACSAEIPQRSGCSGRRASSRATQGMGEYLLPPSRAFLVPSARFHFSREAKSGTALCGGHPHLVPRTRQAQLLSSRQARQSFPPLIEPGPSRHSAAVSDEKGPVKVRLQRPMGPQPRSMWAGGISSTARQRLRHRLWQFLFVARSKKKVTQHLAEATPTRCPVRAKRRCSVRDQSRTNMHLPEDAYIN